MNRPTKLIPTLLGTILALSSCGEPVAAGPAALSRDEHGLKVAVCLDVELQGIYGEYKSSSSGGEWVAFMDVAGSARLESGATIEVADGVEGMDGPVDSIPLDSLRSLALSFVGSELGGGFGANFRGTGEDGSLEVPVDAWLQTSGEITAVACP